MIKRILIDLDSLLDTRLGAIQNLNPAAVEHLVSNDNYWLRENDDWTKLTNGLVTTEQFNEYYDKRGEHTADILNASMMTGIMPFIMRILSEDSVNRSNDMGDANSLTALSVNIWPYELSGEYRIELEEIMKEQYGSTMIVDIISKPIDELTPKYLDANFAMCITYDFIKWSKLHYLELSKVRMSCFNFIGPKIFEQDVSEVSLERKQFELFRFKIEKLIHMDFDFIDSAMFSMFRARK